MISEASAKHTPQNVQCCLRMLRILLHAAKAQKQHTPFSFKMQLLLCNNTVYKDEVWFCVPLL